MSAFKEVQLCKNSPDSYAQLLEMILNVQEAFPHMRLSRFYTHGFTFQSGAANSERQVELSQHQNEL